jgi:hypothetical protein
MSTFYYPLLTRENYAAFKVLIPDLAADSGRAMLGPSGVDNGLEVAKRLVVSAGPPARHRFPPQGTGAPSPSFLPNA